MYCRSKNIPTSMQFTSYNASPGQTGSQRRYVLGLSFVRPFVCCQTYEHGSLKMNKPILMQIGACRPRTTARNDQLGGQQVKGQGQGRTRPKVGLDLKAFKGGECLRILSRPTPSPAA